MNPNSHIFNRDGFNWWIGVVEDRNDPEKMGRCKVRIFGYHTDDKDDLPIKDLPWAWPIQPITSAGISGKGTSPLGPLPGSWVVGWFLDGKDMQQPAFFGVISARAGEMTFDPSNDDKPKTDQPDTTTNPNDGFLRDSQGEIVRDSQGDPIRTGKPPVPGWELGKTSERFESGGRGPGTINDYNGKSSGDFGGASYGIYQLASYLPAVSGNGKTRPSAKGSPLETYVKRSKYANEFKGLAPATPEFDNKWKEIASNEANDFRKDQHDFIKSRYYDVMVTNLKRYGFNADKYGPGVQDLIWSTAVQLGPTNTSVFTEPLSGKSTLTDKDVINLVSEYKKARVPVLFKSSSASIQEGVKSRYESEKIALLKLSEGQA
jgi:hypothetical protein